MEISPEMIKALDRRCQAFEHLNNTIEALVGKEDLDYCKLIYSAVNRRYCHLFD